MNYKNKLLLLKFFWKLCSTLVLRLWIIRWVLRCWWLAVLFRGFHNFYFWCFGVWGCDWRFSLVNNWLLLIQVHFYAWRLEIRNKSLNDFPKFCNENHFNRVVSHSVFTLDEYSGGLLRLLVFVDETLPKLPVLSLAL